MKPIANNGTLRLPLKTVGLHEPDTALAEPEDPDTSAVTEESAPISTSSVATTAAAESTAQPTEQSTEQSTATVGVDPIEPPQQTEVPTTDNTSEDEDEPKEFKSWQDYWDWLTGKVDDLWSKLTGSEDGDESS